jgi:hypothetical protein
MERASDDQLFLKRKDPVVPNSLQEMHYWAKHSSKNENTIELLTCLSYSPGLH